MKRILFALSLAPLLGTGCSTQSFTCSPACATGFVCDTSSGVCIPGGTVDMMGGGGDGGSCPQACSGLTPYCNSSNHCVGCTMDSQCPSGHFCKVVSDSIATCAIGCMSDDRCGGGTMKCCNMVCVDTGADPANCGACGKTCTAPNEQAACSGGQCQPGTCLPGWGDCDGNAQNGCEANLHADPNNCTACGMKCALSNAIVGCADGCYITSCMFGFADCDNNMGNGCETSVLSDPANCGGCGVPCNGLPNAKANCASGNCVLGSCNQGYANCDGDPKNGCEVNLATDANNCNGCGNVCPMNMPSCDNGVCGTLFTFSGVQTNLSLNQLGGWTLCYKDLYGNSGTALATILNGCKGSNLLLACRQAAQPNTLLLAAEAPRADVTFETGGGMCTNNQMVHQANGVGWYYDASWSWGFVKGGDTANLCSCDTANTDPGERLCWHTGGMNINGGYRCGSTTGLNGDMTYERLIFSNM